MDKIETQDKSKEPEEGEEDLSEEDLIRISVFESQKKLLISMTFCDNYIDFHNPLVWFGCEANYCNKCLQTYNQNISII